VNTSVVLSVAALVVAVIVAAVNGRSALAAQKAQGETNLKIAKGDEENNAGRLALDYARQISNRVSSLERWREETVEQWWPEHRARDAAIEAELLKLDPQASIPPESPLPRLRHKEEAG
jgi:hypothetical protein